jgi:hypothetical protein
MKPAEAQTHIEKHGHAALYSRHTCRECKLDWTCRLQTCRLEQEDVLCRACEVESLLSDVLNITDALAPILALEPVIDSVWSQSLKLALAPKIKALRADAMRICKMEKI